jgi:RNA polymerase sigma-70 factor (ECF subfamily)
MGQIALGREAAMADLVRMYGRGLTLYVARFLGNPSQAEDVAQEVFVRAWMQARRYDPGRGSVAAWLYRIATNLCIDRQRRARFRRFFAMADVAEMADDLAAGEPDAETTLAARETLDQVRQAIAGLPGRQRMAILLAAVGGMDTGEIAGIMGTSRGSVEQLLVRSRRTLREVTGGGKQGTEG